MALLSDLAERLKQHFNKVNQPSKPSYSRNPNNLMASKLFNTKFTPQGQTIAGALRHQFKNPQQSFLPSAMATGNFRTGIKPIDRNVVKPIGQTLSGFTDWSSLGLINTPRPKAQTLPEKVGYGVGAGLSFLNPIGAVNLLGKAGKAGQTISKASVARVNAPKLVKKAAPVLGYEAAQTGAFAGVKAALNQDFDPKTDLAAGLGLHGLGKLAQFRQVGTQGKKMAKTQYEYIAKNDKKKIIDTLDRIIHNSEDPTYYIQKRPKDEAFLKQMAEDYAGKEFMKKSKGNIQDVAQELLNRIRDEDNMKAMDLPGLGLVGKNQGLRTTGRGSYTNVRSVDNPLTQVKKTAQENLPLTQKGVSQVETQKLSVQPLVRLVDSNNVSKTGLRTQPRTPLQSLKQVSQKSKISGQSFDDIVRSSDIDVKSKVNFLDYLRTPDRVLKKIGLHQESDLIRKKYDDYQKELPKEIERVTTWSKRVSPDANQRIFKYLDGQELVPLNKEELQVANEIRDYLVGWADRLKLPKEKRITNYITHIFEKDFIQKEFDPDVARLIRDRVAGSVYDPFVEQRLGKAGYIEDTWQSLDAYVKRAVRKANMDEALEQVSKKAEKLEESQFNYVKSYIDRVNMRPTKVDNLIDNTVKQVLGYRLGQRPTAYVTRNLRQMVYRGTLGLNIGSALRNVTQGANTYAKLGEKYTVIGYTKLAKNLLEGDDELQRVGVLKNDFIQDRSMNATRKFWEKADKALFAFFEFAEKVNRGAAYYGAKSKALNKGMNEEQAIEYAKNIVRDTQFTFGSVDTPQVLQSDMAKTLLQFQSFNLKQTEFLGEMAKNKEYAGMVRWGLANTAMLYTIGELIGLSPKDMIPFGSILTGDTKLGQTPPVKLAGDLIGAAVGSKDQYGNDQDIMDRLNTLGNDLVPFIPGGVQIKKSIDAVGDFSRGYDESRSGRVKFPINQSPATAIRGVLFGTNKLPEAQEYFREGRTPLDETQSKFIQNTSPNEKQSLYNKFIENRKANTEDGEVKEQLQSSGGAITSSDKIQYLNSDGSVKTISLTPPTRGQGIDAFVNENWEYSKAREVWKAKDIIGEEQTNAAFKKLGVKPEDVRYDYLANHDNDIKTQYIISKNLDHDTLIERLVTGRMRSVSGKVFASDGVIDDLFDAGLLTTAEKKALKALDYDVNGKQKVASGGGGRKKAAVNPPAFKEAPSTQIKLQKPKFARLRQGNQEKVLEGAEKYTRLFKQK